MMSAHETLDHLVRMTNQTNLLALDKVLFNIRSSPKSYEIAALMCSRIGSRMVRAMNEVGMTLPPDQRATMKGT